MLSINGVYTLVLENQVKLLPFSDSTEFHSNRDGRRSPALILWSEKVFAFVLCCALKLKIFGTVIAVVTAAKIRGALESHRLEDDQWEEGQEQHRTYFWRHYQGHRLASAL